MNGIQRIYIDSDWGNNNERVRMSRYLSPAADDIYRDIFSSMGLRLCDGSEFSICSKEEALARYDWKEGIDVILTFDAGGRATLQEKFLQYPRSTATFTETQKQKPGAWYTCTAQYYFVGYAKDYWGRKLLDMRDWMLIDFPGLRRQDAMQSLPWKYNGNSHPDYEGITFRYLDFDEVPTNCIVARYYDTRQLEFWY